MSVDLANLKPVKVDDVPFEPLPDTNGDNCVSVMSTGTMKCNGNLFVKGCAASSRPRERQIDRNQVEGRDEAGRLCLPDRACRYIRIP
jgi:hypothetical protein